MKRFFILLMMVGFAFSQNVVRPPQIKRILLTGTQTKCVYFAFDPGPGYSPTAADTSTAYDDGATATINPPDAVKWSGNCGLNITGTFVTAEESDSLQVIVKPMGYKGVCFYNDSTWCDFNAVPPSYSTSVKTLNWADGKKYATSLTGYLPVNCYGVMVIVKSYAANTATADAYFDVELITY